MDWGKIGQTVIDYGVGAIATKAGTALSDLSKAANKIAMEKLGTADAAAVQLRSSLPNPYSNTKYYIYAGIGAAVLLLVIVLLHKRK